MFETIQVRNVQLRNLGRNICRHFHVLTLFFFTTSKSELDDYQQKANVQVTLRVAEGLKT